MLERVDAARQRCDRRRLPVAEHAALDLHPRDELLDEHLLVVPPRERNRSDELGLVVHLRDPDGGAEAGRLDEHRIAERIVDRIAEPDRVMARHRDAAVAHDLLEQVLVHRERGRRDAGADVGDVGELQQPLHRPVLAERAVQDGKDDVHLAERRRRRARRDGKGLRR